MMNALKAYASRALNQVETAVKKRWARHGSTRYLWTSKQVDAAIHYVLFEQGEAMVRYSAADSLGPEMTGPGNAKLVRLSQSAAC